MSQRRLGPLHDLSSDELFTRVLTLDDEDPEFVAALVTLHQRPTIAVYRRAVDLCRSESGPERSAGLRVLRELGPAPDASPAGRTFELDALPLLSAMLSSESDPRVLNWVISCLGYYHAREEVDAVSKHALHADGGVRFQVAASLSSLLMDLDLTDAAFDALAHLARDVEPDTRYYAVFALIEEFPVDQRTRILLRDLVDETDEQIRELIENTLDI